MAERGNRLTMRSGTTVCGEHLVAVLVVGVLVLIALATFPGLKTGADDVATRAEIRASAPPAETYYLENGVSAAMVPEALPLDFVSDEFAFP